MAMKHKCPWCQTQQAREGLCPECATAEFHKPEDTQSFGEVEDDGIGEVEDGMAVDDDIED